MFARFVKKAMRFNKNVPATYARGGGDPLLNLFGRNGIENDLGKEVSRVFLRRVLGSSPPASTEWHGPVDMDSWRRLRPACQ